MDNWKCLINFKSRVIGRKEHFIVNEKEIENIYLEELRKIALKQIFYKIPSG